MRPRIFPTTKDKCTAGKVTKAIGIDKKLGASNSPTRIISTLYKLINTRPKNGYKRLIIIKSPKHIAGTRCAGLIGVEYKPAYTP